MIIKLTLSEILNKCNNWDYFCNEEGWGEYAVAEGGGDVEVCLSEEQCYKYGILKKE